ncbi:MAG TPA: DUF1127 domain-containing protein [Stellaceae bacterium]|nr:DUF1127 domain-containing protein [Stellaceae bacterium]
MTAIPLQSARERPGALRRRLALEALSDATQWFAATLREWRHRRRDRSQLAQLDARLLADIGLTRGDAEFLINKPFWRE